MYCSYISDIVNVRGQYLVVNWETFLAYVDLGPAPTGCRAIACRVARGGEQRQTALA